MTPLDPNAAGATAGLPRPLQLFLDRKSVV